MEWNITQVSLVDVRHTRKQIVTVHSVVASLLCYLNFVATFAKLPKIIC